tara:strand:+ start:2751 stop:5420 length:2670 start_codon:yes stop_codon:yes gene_type:complete
MKKLVLYTLLSSVSSVPMNSLAAAVGYEPKPKSLAEVYERAKIHSSGLLSIDAALKELRKKSIVSKEEYLHVKGSSASQAALVRDLHNMGILGKGVTIWLLENSGFNGHPDVKKYINPASDMKPAEGFTQKQDHGTAMASLAHQLAPKADLVVKHATLYLEPLYAAVGTDLQPQIINASFTLIYYFFDKLTIQEYFGPIFKLDKSFRPLVVKSAGNDAKILSRLPLYHGITKEVLDHFILVGNLRQDGRPMASSGVPGDRKEIQDHFLWVIADDMLAAGDPTAENGYAYITGTSGAAAILSGAASLIKSRYPHFTMKEVAECLLESANRDLFGLFGNGYLALHVVEGPIETLHEPSAGAAAAAASSAPAGPIQIKTIQYNPAQWGKGVLNMKNALLYADLKARSPRAKPEILRRRMLYIVAEEQKDAATLIQQWWKKNKRAIPDHKKPLPLFANSAGPDRQYTIPEPTPAEAAHKEGIHITGDASKKSPAEISVKRRREKDARKSAVDHLKTGTKTLNDVFSEIKVFSFAEFMDWVKKNPGILEYQIKGESFLHKFLSTYDYADTDPKIFTGLFSPFKEEYRNFTVQLIQTISDAPYLPIGEKVMQNFVLNVFKYEDELHLPEGLSMKFLKRLIKSYGNESFVYFDIYRDKGFPPTAEILIKLSSGSKDYFDTAIEHYEAAGYDVPALLNTPNDIGITPFGAYIKHINVQPSEEIESAVKKYLSQGAELKDGIFPGSRSVPGAFIYTRYVEPKRYKDEYGYKDIDSIRESFFGLKKNAFIFDIPGFDKSFATIESTLFYTPEIVIQYIRDSYNSTTISADQWSGLVDAAWGVYEKFLEDNSGATYKKFVSRDYSAGVSVSKYAEQPVRVVGDDGTVFYHTQYSEWELPS